MAVFSKEFVLFIEQLILVVTVSVAEKNDIHISFLFANVQLLVTNLLTLLDLVFLNVFPAPVRSVATSKSARCTGVSILCSFPKTQIRSLSFKFNQSSGNKHQKIEAPLSLICRSNDTLKVSEISCF